MEPGSSPPRLRSRSSRSMSFVSATSMSSTRRTSGWRCASRCCLARSNPLDLWWARPGWGLAVGLGHHCHRRPCDRVPARHAPVAVALGHLRSLHGRHRGSGSRHHDPMACRTGTGRAVRWVLVTSPEILVFLFFMITHPKTAPKGRVSQVIYGMGVAVVASLLAAPQQTEFATRLRPERPSRRLRTARSAPTKPSPHPTPSGARQSAAMVSRNLPGSAERRTRPRPAAHRRSCGRCGSVSRRSLLDFGRAQAACSAASTAGGPVLITGRPVVRIGDASLPSASIGSDAHTLYASISQHQARDIARDLLADLIHRMACATPDR